MPPPEDAEIERVIVSAIERHARGDVPALARQIVTTLRRVGFEIVNRPEMIPIRRNPMP